jgi:hypothetical protein
MEAARCARTAAVPPPPLSDVWPLPALSAGSAGSLQLSESGLHCLEWLLADGGGDDGASAPASAGWAEHAAAAAAAELPPPLPPPWRCLDRSHPRACDRRVQRLPAR